MKDLFLIFFFFTWSFALSFNAITTLFQLGDGVVGGGWREGRRRSVITQYAEIITEFTQSLAGLFLIMYRDDWWCHQMSKHDQLTNDENLIGQHFRPIGSKWVPQNSGFGAYYPEILKWDRLVQIGKIWISRRYSFFWIIPANKICGYHCSGKFVSVHKSTF